MTRVGILGGPGTFAGQAAMRLLATQPRLEREPVPYPSVEEMWAALECDAVTHIVLGTYTQHTGMASVFVERFGRVGSPFYVDAEAILPYGCALLVKPGIRMRDIRRITGHGSLHECASYLARALPGTPWALHPENSVAAAREVLASDGSLAVVSTLRTGKDFGLVPLARNIEEGSRAVWWAISTRESYRDQPSTLVVAGTYSEGTLGETIRRFVSSGLRLRAVGTVPTGTSLYQTLAMCVFEGGVSLDLAQDLTAASPGSRLAGAF